MSEQRKDAADDVLEIQLNPTLSVSVKLAWNDPETGELQHEILVPTADRGMVDFVSQILISGPENYELDVEESVIETLLSKGVLLSEDLELPQPRLSAHLTDALGSTQTDEPLVLSPHFHFHPELPDEVSLSVGDTEFVFEVGANTLWSCAPDTRMWHPYLLTDEDVVLVRALRSGARAVQSLDPQQRKRMQVACVLIPPAASNAARWAANAAALNAEFKANGAAIIRNWLPLGQLTATSDYCRVLRRSGQVREDPRDQAAQRLNRYREAYCEFLHRQSVPLVRAILQDDGVRPSYSFFGVYRAGAILPRHKDRPQCQYNVSLVLDAEPAEASSQWPLYVEDQNGKAHAASLNVGDAVLYSGVESAHWRDTLPSTLHSATATFFHYVPADFDGSLD